MSAHVIPRLCIFFIHWRGESYLGELRSLTFGIYLGDCSHKYKSFSQHISTMIYYLTSLSHYTISLFLQNEHSTSQLFPVDKTCQTPLVPLSVNQYLTSMSIEDILRITIEAHDGLKDLNGNPAIPHPLAVGLAGKNELEQKVGFLHDVVEDSPITIADLRARGVEEDVLEAVDLLTHRSGMTYHEYVRNIVCSGNLTAMRVKLNDL